MDIQVKRAFVHKAHGEIGEIELASDVKKMVLNGVELPQVSIDYLLTFAMQTLQDAYAGAKDQDEAQKAFEAKLERIQKGEIGVRGAGVDPMVKIQRDAVKRALKAKGLKIKDFDNDQLDKIFADNGELLKPIVDEIVKEQREREAKLAKLGNSLDLGAL